MTTGTRIGVGFGVLVAIVVTLAVVVLFNAPSGSTAIMTILLVLAGVILGGVMATRITGLEMDRKPGGG